MSTDHHLTADVVAELERLLSAHFGTAVAIAGRERLKDSRTSIHRLSLEGAPVSSAICRYGPREDTVWNELAGMRFLAQVPRPPAAVPAFYGGGPVGSEMAVVLSEDLGDAPDLASILLRGTAAAATAGLEAYVDALLDVHLATFGRREEHAAIRAAYDPPRDSVELLREGHWAKLADGLEKVGIGPVPAGVPDAIAWVDALLEPSDRWWAFSLCDCCPDNNQVGPDGRVTLFDLEFAGCRHALLDLAYVRTFMPTCWCLRRLPDELSARLVSRYREKLLAARPELTAGEFEEAFAAARAFWALTTMGWHLENAFGQPGGGERRYFEVVDFAMASPGEVVRLRLGDLATVAGERAELEPLGALAKLIAGQLDERWPAIELLPLYPAFTAGATA